MGSKLFTFLLVFFFGGAIVLIGAQELSQKYSDSNLKSRENPERLIERLHGRSAGTGAIDGGTSPVIGRALLNSESGEQARARVVVPPAERRGDDLSRKDREELDTLLGSVVP